MSDTHSFPPLETESSQPRPTKKPRHADHNKSPSHRPAAPSIHIHNHGRGTITLALIAHRASLTALASTYPLRLISPRSHSTLGTHAAVYVLTFGGGVLSTDRLSLDVRVGRGCALSLHTQGNTKIFMPPPTTVGLDDGAGSGQTHTRGRRRQAPHQLLTCRIEPHALLCVLPDPTTLFAGASYTQHQTFHLANEDASLVLLDWYTSGRASRGEVWAWERFESRNEVLVGRGDGDKWKDGEMGEHSTLKETCILRDTWLLENTAASPKQQTTYASRMGHYHCFANLILIGSRTSQIRKRIEEEFAKIVIVTSGSGGAGGGGHSHSLSLSKSRPQNGARQPPPPPSSNSSISYTHPFDKPSTPTVHAFSIANAIDDRPDPLWSCSPIPNDIHNGNPSEGIVLRAASTEPARMREFLKKVLAEGLKAEIGEDVLF